MADSSLWQNSNGEIITCENGKIAYTAECPCGQELYVPAVVFLCDLFTGKYYAPYDTKAYIKIINNKITKIYTGKKDSSNFIDRTEAVKEGNFKIFSYVDPFGKIGKLGPFGERSSLVYEDTLCPPQTSSSLDFLTYEDTRLACFYEYEKTKWIVPASWYYYTLDTNYNVHYNSEGTEGSWGGYSKRVYEYTITPYTEDISNQSTQLAFKVTYTSKISDSQDVLCKDTYTQGNVVKTEPVDSSVILSTYSLPYGTRLISASYEGCDGYKSPISISDIEKTRVPITARLTLHPDDRLPSDLDYCMWYNPMPSGEEGCSYDYYTRVNQDSTWEMVFVDWYNSGLVLYTKSTPNYSFTGITATYSGDDSCWVSGAFNCEAEGNGTASLNFFSLIEISRSDTKVSCTYANDKRMLSLFPLKIE